MIALPLSPAGVHVTVSCWFPRTATTLVAATGGPAGTTAFEANDGDDWLTALIATTRNVYEVPLVSPVTLHVNAEVVEHTLESGVDVTVYPVTVEPLPFDADHETIACALPAIAATLEGTLGPAAGITAAEAAEAAELPTVFVATTRNVYDVPLVSPETVQLTPEVEHVRLPGVDVTV